MSEKTFAILVVDDDDIIADSICLLLETRGYRVGVATDGRTALERLAAESFDLVITDIVMAEMDGIETIKEIRKLSTSIPIIAMSGGGRTSTHSYLEAAQKLGANAILEKPFDEDELFAKIDEAISDLGVL